MIIIPSLFITTMYRVLAAWQFHIRWNSWPHHNVEIDLACRDFPFFFSTSEACTDFYFWWQREYDVLGFFALFNYIWCHEVRFDGAQRARAAGPVYVDKQWNKGILWSLQSDYRSLFPLQKRHNKCLSCLFKVMKAQQGSYSPYKSSSP